MQDTIFIRLRFVMIGLATLAGLVVLQLLRIEFTTDSQTYLRNLSDQQSERLATFAPPRGSIFDRDGDLLAANSVQYELGVSPGVLSENQIHELAISLSTVLDKSVGELEEAMLKGQAEAKEYVLLARPISAEIGDRIETLQEEDENFFTVSLTPIPHRVYPGLRLAAQALGFVGYSDYGQQGYYGVEGFYNDLLAGRSVDGKEYMVPFDAQPNPAPDEGADLYLTIDRDLQFLVEGALQSFVQTYGAEGGSILVMDPRTGEILAMAASPSYDPNNYATSLPGDPQNPVVSGQFEPGSTFKVLTMAAALDAGLVQPTTPFYDGGVIEVGGVPIRNWNQSAFGAVDMVGCMRHSINVCMSALSTQLGPQTFYNYMAAFGIGHRTSVDLSAEAPGRLKVPGDPDWYESDLGTNAFGQGVAVTPLQLVTAISAVANDGVIMQPHILKRVEAGGRILFTQPQVLGRPIRPETAHTLSEMLATALEAGEAEDALVPGYRIAGKTGTSQIPIPGGYDERQTIASFIGWGPIDDPQFIVLVKLDKPRTSIWGSETAAPAFGSLVNRMVVLMELPPDNVRQALAGQ